MEFIATGRRKNAVARIRMTPGTGKIEVNGRAFEEYFPTAVLQNTVLAPIQTAKTGNIYDLNVNAHGVGPTGQAGAIRLAIARALLQTDENLRAPLREDGLLTRDPQISRSRRSRRSRRRISVLSFATRTSRRSISTLRPISSASPARSASGAGCAASPTNSGGAARRW